MVNRYKCACIILGLGLVEGAILPILISLHQFVHHFELPLH